MLLADPKPEITSVPAELVLALELAWTPVVPEALEEMSLELGEAPVGPDETVGPGELEDT